MTYPQHYMNCIGVQCLLCLLNLCNLLANDFAGSYWQLTKDLFVLIWGGGKNKKKYLYGVPHICTFSRETEKVNKRLIHGFKAV
jgi:hypothetical protein